MAHKTLVDGTAYEISGGKTLVDGTAYSIKNGKTLVDGTAYEVCFREKYTITITSDQSTYFANASVLIDGKYYITENSEIKVVEGSVITCSVTGDYSMGANESGTGRIIVNGVEVVTAYGCSKKYDYVVKSDVSIHLNTTRDTITLSYGIITITEH